MIAIETNPQSTPINRFHPFLRLPCDATRTLILFEIAGSRYAHNPKVEGSNPSPATIESITYAPNFKSLINCEHKPPVLANLFPLIDTPRFIFSAHLKGINLFGLQILTSPVFPEKRESIRRLTAIETSSPKAANQAAKFSVANRLRTFGVRSIQTNQQILPVSVGDFIGAVTV